MHQSNESASIIHIKEYCMACSGVR